MKNYPTPHIDAKPEEAIQKIKEIQGNIGRYKK